MFKLLHAYICNGIWLENFLASGENNSFKYSSYKTKCSSLIQNKVIGNRACVIYRCFLMIFLNPFWCC